MTPTLHCRAPERQNYQKKKRSELEKSQIGVKNCEFLQEKGQNLGFRRSKMAKIRPFLGIFLDFFAFLNRNVKKPGRYDERACKNTALDAIKTGKAQNFDT